MKSFLIVGLLLGFSICAFPQSGSIPVPGAQAVSALQSVSDKIPMSISAGVMAILVFLVELLMRFVPSVQPRSLFLMVSAGLKLIAGIMEKISALLDSVVQNLKDK